MSVVSVGSDPSNHLVPLILLLKNSRFSGLESTELNVKHINYPK